MERRLGAALMLAIDVAAAGVLVFALMAA